MIHTQHSPIPSNLSLTLSLSLLFKFFLLNNNSYTQFPVWLTLLFFISHSQSYSCPTLLSAQTSTGWLVSLPFLLSLFLSSLLLVNLIETGSRKELGLTRQWNGRRGVAPTMKISYTNKKQESNQYLRAAGRNCLFRCPLVIKKKKKKKKKKVVVLGQHFFFFFSIKVTPLFGLFCFSPFICWVGYCSSLCSVSRMWETDGLGFPSNKISNKNKMIYHRKHTYTHFRSEIELHNKK